jgi:hypothetical protein
VSDEAGRRSHEAWNARYTHGKAARVWDSIAAEDPERAPIARILAKWMAAYEAADAEAEEALRELQIAAPCCGAEYAYAGGGILGRAVKNRTTTCSRPKGHEGAHQGEEKT